MVLRPQVGSDRPNNKMTAVEALKQAVAEAQEPSLAAHLAAHGPEGPLFAWGRACALIPGHHTGDQHAATRLAQLLAADKFPPADGDNQQQAAAGPADDAAAPKEDTPEEQIRRATKAFFQEEAPHPLRATPRPFGTLNAATLRWLTRSSRSYPAEAPYLPAKTAGIIGASPTGEANADPLHPVGPGKELLLLRHEPSLTAPTRPATAFTFTEGEPLTEDAAAQATEAMIGARSTPASVTNAESAREKLQQQFTVARVAHGCLVLAPAKGNGEAANTWRGWVLAGTMPQWANYCITFIGTTSDLTNKDTAAEIRSEIRGFRRQRTLFAVAQATTMAARQLNVAYRLPADITTHSTEAASIDQHENAIDRLQRCLHPNSSDDADDALLQEAGGHADGVPEGEPARGSIAMTSADRSDLTTRAGLVPDASPFAAGMAIAATRQRYLQDVAGDPSTPIFYQPGMDPALSANAAFQEISDTWKAVERKAAEKGRTVSSPCTGARLMAAAKEAAAAHERQKDPPVMRTETFVIHKQDAVKKATFSTLAVKMLHFTDGEDTPRVAFARGQDARGHQAGLSTPALAPLTWPFGGKLLELRLHMGAFSMGASAGELRGKAGASAAENQRSATQMLKAKQRPLGLKVLFQHHNPKECLNKTQIATYTGGGLLPAASLGVEVHAEWHPPLHCAATSPAFLNIPPASMTRRVEADRKARVECAETYGTHGQEFWRLYDTALTADDVDEVEKSTKYLDSPSVAWARQQGLLPPHDMSTGQRRKAALSEGPDDEAPEDPGIDGLAAAADDGLDDIGDGYQPSEDSQDESPSAASKATGGGGAQKSDNMEIDGGDPPEYHPDTVLGKTGLRLGDLPSKKIPEPPETDDDSEDGKDGNQPSLRPERRLRRLTREGGGGVTEKGLWESGPIGAIPGASSEEGAQDYQWDPRDETTQGFIPAAEAVPPPTTGYELEEPRADTQLLRFTPLATGILTEHGTDDDRAALTDFRGRRIDLHHSCRHLETIELAANKAGWDHARLRNIDHRGLRLGKDVREAQRRALGRSTDHGGSLSKSGAVMKARLKTTLVVAQARHLTTLHTKLGQAITEAEQRKEAARQEKEQAEMAARAEQQRHEQAEKAARDAEERGKGANEQRAHNDGEAIPPPKTGAGVSTPSFGSPNQRPAKVPSKIGSWDAMGYFLRTTLRSCTDHARHPLRDRAVPLPDKFWHNEVARGGLTDGDARDLRLWTQEVRSLAEDNASDIDVSAPLPQLLSEFVKEWEVTIPKTTLAEALVALTRPRPPATRDLQLQQEVLEWTGMVTNKVAGLRRKAYQHPEEAEQSALAAAPEAVTDIALTWFTEAKQLTFAATAQQPGHPVLAGKPASQQQALRRAVYIYPLEEEVDGSSATGATPPGGGNGKGGGGAPADDADDDDANNDDDGNSKRSRDSTKDADGGGDASPSAKRPRKDENGGEPPKEAAPSDDSAAILALPRPLKEPPRNTTKTKEQTSPTKLVKAVTKAAGAIDATAVRHFIATASAPGGGPLDTLEREQEEIRRLRLFFRNVSTAALRLDRAGQALRKHRNATTADNRTSSPGDSRTQDGSGHPPEVQGTLDATGELVRHWEEHLAAIPQVIRKAFTEVNTQLELRDLWFNTRAPLVPTDARGAGVDPVTPPMAPTRHGHYGPNTLTLGNPAVGHPHSTPNAHVDQLLETQERYFHTLKDLPGAGLEATKVRFDIHRAACAHLSAQGELRGACGGRPQDESGSHARPGTELDHTTPRSDTGGSNDRTAPTGEQHDTRLQRHAQAVARTAISLRAQLELAAVQRRGSTTPKHQRALRWHLAVAADVIKEILDEAMKTLREDLGHAAATLDSAAVTGTLCPAATAQLLHEGSRALLEEATTALDREGPTKDIRRYLTSQRTESDKTDLASTSAYQTGTAELRAQRRAVHAALTAKGADPADLAHLRSFLRHADQDGPAAGLPPSSDDGDSDDSAPELSPTKQRLVDIAGRAADEAIALWNAEKVLSPSSGQPNRHQLIHRAAHQLQLPRPLDPYSKAACVRAGLLSSH